MPENKIAFFDKSEITDRYIRGYLMRKYYIFLVDASTHGYDGFMPIGGRQGLVFTGDTTSSYQAMAYELGHSLSRS